MQKRIVTHGLSLLERAARAETVEYSAESWGSDDWKTAYMEVNDSNRLALQKMGEALRENRQVREKRVFD